MKAKVVSVFIALLFMAMLVPSQAQAGYSLGVTGKTDFFPVAYQPTVYNGTDVYMRIYLSETSPTSLRIDIARDGELGQYVSFPEFAGAPSFTLFPGENRKVLYELDLPGLDPGKHFGSIMAVGTPPVDNATQNASAIGKPVVGLTLVADVASDVQIYDFVTTSNGFPDAQSAVWGDGWSTGLSIVNGGNSTFNGYCNLTLETTGVLESVSFNVTNLSVAASVSFDHDWQDGLALGTQYFVRAVIFTDLHEMKDEEVSSFTIPSPANILSVERFPTQVFMTDTVGVYAVLASSDSTVTLHMRINNGTETTTPMSFAAGEFGAAIPPQAIGSTVQYWITSSNGAYSDRSPAAGSYSYYVFSPDLPDLLIQEDSISFSPINPLNTTMNATQSTDIFIQVRNTGRGAARNVVVRVYDHELPIWWTSIAVINGQDSAFVRFKWTPVEGEFILRFTADPDNSILEINENNNHFTLPGIAVGPAPVEPEPEEPETENPLGIVPYLLIPLILAALIILLLKRKKIVNVTIIEAKPSKADPRRWIYTCGVGDMTIGKTRVTDVVAQQGSVIRVSVSAIREDEDGTIVWENPEVLGAGKAEDEEAKVRKMAKKG
jgi:hypothetical protein